MSNTPYDPKYEHEIFPQHDSIPKVYKKIKTVSESK